jgi:hypothetical protein
MFYIYFWHFNIQSAEEQQGGLSKYQHYFKQQKRIEDYQKICLFMFYQKIDWILSNTHVPLMKLLYLGISLS